MLRRLLIVLMAAMILVGVHQSGIRHVLAAERHALRQSAQAGTASPAPSPEATPDPSPSPAPPPPPPPPPPAPPSFDGLQAQVQGLAAGVGAQVGVSLIELGGSQPQSWSYNGDQQFTAASTYKLPALMADAQAIAAGQAGGGDQICYQDWMWEDGVFGDYYDGACYSRDELAWRAGHYSDNTAAHMLVEDLGGGSALNSYAAQHGATGAALYDPNVTTAQDLAALWANEATGGAGGAAAQAWLYPLLTNTEHENCIPAGVPAGTQVVHKTGSIDLVENDAALVVNGPHGPYVLVVLTDGAGGDLGTELIAQVSAAVWQFEAARPA